MRYTEFNPSISEAPMNPGEYHKAIDTGQTKGVLVGFEFECVVPKATIQGFQEPEATAVAPQGRTKESVAEIIREYDVLLARSLADLKPVNFDKIFKFLPGKSQYPDLSTAHKAYERGLIEKAKELFSKVPEKIRIKAIPVAKADSTLSSGWQPTNNKQLNFVYQLGRILSAQYRTRRQGGGQEIQDLGNQLARLTSDPDYVNLLRFTFPGQDYSRITNFLDFDPEVAYEKLDLSDYEDEEDEYDSDSYGGGQSDDYRGAVKILKPALEQSQGRTVTVFTRYHEKSKNMTDWYIEPDGSLEGDNDGDGTAEVVSPPLPAKEAITALKNFFAMAAQNKIYTNQSTGLHINVSIPDNIDILKLAVFTGDQYVLKHFNRLDNDYAAPVTKDIPRRAGGQAVSVKQGPARDKNVFGKRKQTSTVNTDLLQRIAKDISSAHMASISYNGKWVSFRHTGGNYLKDYTEIYNVVGRFVRAVIIASDPTMYVQEYKAAVAKMAAPKDTISGTLQSTLNYIASKGLPVLEINFAGKGPTFDMKKMFKKVCSSSYSLPSPERIDMSKISLTPNSAEAKQKMIAIAKPDGNFAKWAVDASNAVFASAIYYPRDEHQMRSFAESDPTSGVNATHGRGGNTDGYYTVRKSVIPGNDPRAKQMMINMRKAHYLDR